MSEKTITITQKELTEANAKAAANVTEKLSKDDKGGPGISLMTVMIGALLSAELMHILFPEKNEAEEKLAESLKGDAE